jgi:hypothetical protein
MLRKSILCTLSSGTSESTAQAEVDEWTMLERIRRASMWLGASWCLAGFSLVIPGLHFVFPPVLLVAGPILWVWRFVGRFSVRAVHGRCPQCHKESSFEAQGVFRSRTRVVCNGCTEACTLSLNSGLLES